MHLSIGTFSSRSRLSVRMLRHYDEHGLLVPADVDPQTGYRRYAPEQLALAARIRSLRDVGFTVSGIAAVLATAGTPAYEHALRVHRDVLAAELHDAEQRVFLIDRLITNEGQDMTDITVSRTTFPAMTVVALRGTVPTYADEPMLWGPFMREVQAQDVKTMGFGGVIEHDGETREADVDESVWLPVEPGTAVREPLVTYDFPERDVVVARVVGPYTLITESHDRIDEFALAAGIELADGDRRRDMGDHNFNIYRTMPGEVLDDQHVTDVYMVVRD